MKKMPDDIDYLKINRQTWDQRTAVHIKSDFYDVNGFLQGNTSLREIELAEMPDVAGKKMLHLQCHFGLDSLSWTRKGALVTGVDISQDAIDKATELAQQTRLDAQFICDDIYHFGVSVAPQYDIVFVSYGAICWLPSITRWAELIAASLKPGGLFYMVEFHPVIDLMYNFSYFHRDDPDIETMGTYTDGGDAISTAMATWSHPLADVINALIQAGLTLQGMKEFPFSPYRCFDNLEEKEPGRYYWLKEGHPVPLVYSVTATRNKQ